MDSSRRIKSVDVLSRRTSIDNLVGPRALTRRISVDSLIGPGFLERRKADVQTIRRIIDDIPTKQWDRCMTGERSSVFLSRLENVRLLGSGSFGQVYAAIVGGKTFVVKEAYLDENEHELMQQGIVGNRIDKNAYPHEFKILKLVQTLLKLNKSPNFSYVYNLSACEGCIFGDEPAGSCYLTFMELADGDAYDMPSTSRSDQISIFSQIMLAVSAIHSLSIWHRDIKRDNILFKRVPAGGWYAYVVGDEVFYVENTGYLALLSDFGASAVLAPKYGIGELCGTRNVRVVGDKLEPITIDGNDKYAWYANADEKDIVYGTDNVFTIYNMTTAPFDLNDVKQYRPREYFFDIQDLVRTFIGGWRTTIAEQHSQWPGLDKKFNKTLKKRCFAATFPRNLATALDYLDAARVLRRAVPAIKKPTNIISTFKQ